MTETTPAPVAVPAPAAAPATSVLSTVEADVSKVEATVSADVAKAKADIATAKADNWLVTFITGNAKKIAVGVLVAAGLLVWHFI